LGKQKLKLPWQKAQGGSRGENHKYPPTLRKNNLRGKKQKGNEKKYQKISLHNDLEKVRFKGSENNLGIVKEMAKRDEPHFQYVLGPDRRAKKNGWAAYKRKRTQGGEQGPVAVWGCKGRGNRLNKKKIGLGKGCAKKKTRRFGGGQKKKQKGWKNGGREKPLNQTQEKTPRGGGGGGAKSTLLSNKWAENSAKRGSDGDQKNGGTGRDAAQTEVQSGGGREVKGRGTVEPVKVSPK